MSSQQTELEAALRERLEFTPPRPLVGVIAAFAERAGGIDEGLSMLHEYTRARFGHSFQHFYEGSTPLEFLPFLDTQGDGAAYGYVIHAPELQPDDYPMAFHCPPDGVGLGFTGDSTLEGLENVISSGRYEEGDFADVDLSWLETLGIRSSLHRADYVDMGGKRRPGLSLPAGWMHVMTSDGVGVVAREADFGKSVLPPLPELSCDLAAEGWQQLGDAELAAGHPASALWYFKELWQQHYDGRPEWSRPVFQRLLRAYRALGKHQLVEICVKRYHWLAD